MADRPPLRLPDFEVTHAPHPACPHGARHAASACAALRRLVDIDEALLSEVQRAIYDDHAAHDCGDWRRGHRCTACGTWIGDAYRKDFAR